MLWPNCEGAEWNLEKMDEQVTESLLNLGKHPHSAPADKKEDEEDFNMSNMLQHVSVDILSWFRCPLNACWVWRMQKKTFSAVKAEPGQSTDWSQRNATETMWCIHTQRNAATMLCRYTRLLARNGQNISEPGLPFWEEERSPSASRHTQLFQWRGSLYIISQAWKLGNWRVLKCKEMLRQAFPECCSKTDPCKCFSSRTVAAHFEDRFVTTLQYRPCRATQCHTMPHIL